ncbi:MAG TPA: efflux RND transporter periplasmic adaptor subunit, partial [Thermoanaerobaculia bacterium]|nr:efflux RND transporter periplasmic adaptor subunit [Thermoanaerobaculia bacterium]
CAQRMAAAIGIAAALLGPAGCSRGNAKQAEAKKSARVEFPVEVAKVETRRVEYSVAAVGSVEAFEQVAVTARVPGAIEKVSFSEGDVVNTGTVLVEIEPERYRLAVQSARATLEKSQAAKSEAEAGLKRRETVNQKNPALVKEEDLDSWRTRVWTATAELAQTKSALDLAQLNLKESLVSAPVSGIIQTRNVQTGQYVQPGATIATLVRRDPLLLRFSVPEQDATQLKTGIKARFQVRESPSAYEATITHVAASADQASRMVLVTARVDDPRRAQLRPGAFAQVTIPIGGATDAAVIPQTAVRASERGFLGFVVEGGVARERILTLGLRTADGRVEVRAGLKPGESLVVRGGEALRDGAAVKVTS